MYRHDEVVIDTDDLSLDFLGENAATAASAAEMELEALIDEGDGSGVTVHTEASRVWLMCDEGDDGALDEAVEIFGRFVEEHYGNDVLIKALDSAGKPLS